MALYDRIADLPLRVEEFDLAGRERTVSSDFARTTTVVSLHGGGTTGRGEDVAYDAEDHRALLKDPPALPVPFDGTIDGFSAALDGVDLFPGPPQRDTARRYRRWAVESAALDLALRQAGTDLAAALGRTYDPVRFVVSTRLGEPPSTDRLANLLERYDLEFKLDPTDEWTPEFVDELAAIGRVRILDLKGHYEGTSVDGEPDPDLYRLVVEAFPDAVIEDPALTGETRPVVEPAAERVSWDYPVTGVESIRELPFEPRWLNVKPSRFGTAASLLESVEYCSDRGIQMYGGGQFELDVGRGQIQALASLFYPDAPNDVAPGGFNDPDPPDGLPSSPLRPPADPSGFRW